MLAVDLIFHTVTQFDFQGERLTRGWGELLVIGDSRTGKSQIVDRLIRYYRAGEMTSGENTSLAGLIGGLHQVGDSWALRWGRIPLNDRRLVAIDEAGALPPEQIGRMSSVRSQGVAEVTKIHTEKTNARTRAIWITNPRGQKPLSSYSQGVLAVKEMVGAPEDVARFDIVVTSASGDVPLNIINAERPGGRPEVYTSDLCHQRVMRAWSRRPEQVEWTQEAVGHCLLRATQQGERYGFATEVPLVEPNEQRVKLARLAVAAAAMFFSTDETGETVVVRKEHVEFVYQFLERLYRKPSLAFTEYAEGQARHHRLRNEGEVRTIIDRASGDAPRELLEQEYFQLRDLEEIFGTDTREEIRLIMSTLRSAGFLIRRGKSNFYEKTPAAITFLRYRVSGNGHRTGRLSDIMAVAPAEDMPDEPEF